MTFPVLSVVAKALQIGALVSGLYLARRRLGYRPVAIFLLVMTVIDTIRWPLIAWLLTDAPRPRVGWSRALFHLEQAGFIAWPAGVAALASIVLPRWPSRVVLPIVGGVWAVLVAAVSLAYPGLRQERLGIAYAAITAASVVVGAVAIVVWIRRVTPPAVQHRASLLVVTMTLASLVAPYAFGAISAWANLGSIVFGSMYLLLLVEHGRELWSSVSPSRSPSPARPSHGVLH